MGGPACFKEEPHAQAGHYGLSGVGKSTTCRLVLDACQAHGRTAQTVKLATPLFQLQTHTYGLVGRRVEPGQQDQALLRALADHLRRLNPSFLVEDFLGRVDRAGVDVVVNDDLEDVETDDPCLAATERMAPSCALAESACARVSVPARHKALGLGRIAQPNSSYSRCSRCITIAVFMRSAHRGETDTMADHLEPDVIFRANEQFPLGTPLGLVEASDETPSGGASRPFGLRYLTHARAVTRLDPDRIDYDPVSQMAVVRADGGAHLPLMRRTSGETATETQADDRQAPDSDTDYDSNE